MACHFLTYNIVMKGNKLIRIISTFSENELKEFRKFLVSPFVNDGRNYISFYDNIMINYPNFDKIEELIDNLSENTDNLKTLDYKISHLIKLSCDFLYLKQKKDDKINKLIDLSLILLKKGLSKYAMNLCEEAENKLLNKKKDKDYYYLMFKLSFIKFSANVRLGNLKNQFLCITKMSEYFFIHFYSEIVRMQDNMKSLQGNLNFDYESTYLSNMINSLDFKCANKNFKKLKIENSSLVKIYSLLIEKINKTKDDKYFSEILETLENKLDEIEPLEIVYLVTKLQNDWLWISNKSLDSSMTSSFNVMKKYFLNIYNLDNFSYLKMSTNVFRNIFLISIQLNELEWAEEFIQKYSGKLYPEVKDDMIKWSYGILYLNKKDFKKSLHYLSQVNDVLDVLKFDIRRDILKLNFELKYFDRIPALIDSYKHFLTNTKTTIPFMNEREKIFIEYFPKLYNLAITKDEIKRNLLKKQMKNEILINYDSWFIEKLNEF